MTINFNDLSNITFDGTVYNEVTKASDNTTAITQEKSNISYDNFLLHSSKEWLSTIENTASELVKDAKNVSNKVKADNKVIDAAKKSAPDSNAFKDTTKKITEGVKDFSSSVSAMTEITNYTGAINFVSSTAVNTVTGAINVTADMGVSTKSPSISTTSNVNITNASTNINYADTHFTKTGVHVISTDQQLLSATDKHNLVSNTTSTTSKSNKTAAVEDHQVIANEQKQYSSTHTTLTKDSLLIGTKGVANLSSQGNLVISSGQTRKTTSSQASIQDNISNPISDLNTGGTGSIKILSTGDITTTTQGTIANQADTFGATVAKFGITSIDTAINSTTATIVSKTQTTVSSNGITYTGNKNIGISINPFGILAGSGIAPYIPFLAEQLPPIVLEIPELPEFPFGDLSSFLSKCLPFASVLDELPNVDIPPDTSNVDDEAPLIDLEDPLVIQDKGAIDSPIAIEDTAITKEPKVIKGVKAVQTDRDITTTATTKTDDKATQSLFTSKTAVANAAKLGILHGVCIDPPEGELNKTSTTTTTSDIPEICITPTTEESLKSLTSLQKAEVVNSFNPNQRSFISNNYNDFLKAASIVDVYGANLNSEITNNSAQFSKNVLEILKDNNYVNQIQTFLNTKRPTGVGGQQPPNIQTDISTANVTIANRTPPTPGQGILDVLTSLNTAKQSPNVISKTTENWFTPEDLNDSTLTFGDEFTSNSNLSGITDLLNNKYVQLATQAIPDSKIQSALSLTQDIVSGRITTPEQYAEKLASLIGGNVTGYIDYAKQAINIYGEVQKGNYTSLLGIPGISNVLGAQGSAIASKVLDLVSKKNITDKDIYSLVGSIFTALTGTGLSLLDELAKLLGCINSLKQQDPFLQDLPDSDLQDIIDYLPRVIQTVDPKKRAKVFNITPSNCGQISLLSAEEATINLKEIGVNYIKFELANKDLIRFNNNPLPNIATPVNVYCEYFTDRVTNKVLSPYKFNSQFTSNILEYKITNKIGTVYTASLNNSNITLILEDAINGSLYQYKTKDIGNRLIPYVLDSYILL